MKRLHISTAISVDALNQMVPDLTASLHAHLMVRKRPLSARAIHLLCILIRVCCILGLLLSSLLLYWGQPFRPISIQLGIMIVFLVLLWLFWDSNKVQQRRLAFRSSVLHWSARTRSVNILKTAKKSAPFHAEYDFRGETVVYHRVGPERASFVWSRKLTGYLLSGNGYTLLFKKEKSLNPYAIFLHDAGDGLLQHLDELGIKKLVIAAGNA